LNLPCNWKQDEAMDTAKTKPFNIDKKLVYDAYKAVKANAGAAGVDGQSLEMFDKDLMRNLYKIWNRMSSGSYFPPAVRAVPIPKKNGGQRLLGVPTVADRVAQMVVKKIVEREVEPIFLPDSYGYRPNKSAIDAIGVTRKRCWQYDWVLEFDIRGLFDNINHTLLLRAVHKHVKCKWSLLYIERWLTAPMEMEDGTRVERSKGTPQGGVISPVLANLFLHYTFDAWMAREYPGLPWCRYADDGLVHCRTKAEAVAVKAKLAARFAECHLEMHPDKTRIIYCKDGNRRRKYADTKFDFLGYCFGPTDVKNGERKEVFTSFSPRVSASSLKAMRQEIKKLNLRRQTHIELEDIAHKLNPILQGWMNYYGRYYPAALDPVWHHVNATLVAWVRRKYKRYRGKKLQASQLVKSIATKRRRLFVHWRQGYTGSFA
jgi:group II intron reverse transcriptase/maturase